MSAITDPSTRRRLQEKGCLVNNEVDRLGLSKSLAVQLEAHHVAADPADIVNVERTVGRLVEDFLGFTDEDVVRVAKGLLSPGPNGLVQTALSNGYVLCARQARRLVVVEGELHRVSLSTRFLTANHDSLQQYRLAPGMEQVTSVLRRVREDAQFVERRQPGMSPQIGGFLRELADRAQTELSPPPPPPAQPVKRTRKRREP